MIYDFICIDKNCKKPVYLQIYENVKTAIENGSLKKDSRLPSIRKLSADLNISKTTVENAYNQLCVEGYIKNYPQKGYFVEAQLNIVKRKSPQINSSSAETAVKKYAYDFGSRSIENSSSIAEWKKAVKNILNKDYLLHSYGEPQGEPALRDALEKYSFSVRGVNASAENIVIGGGTQPLLYILCGLLGTGKTAAVDKGMYVQAEQVFRDFGYTISYFDSDRYGIDLNSLKKIHPDLLLMNPNFNAKNGSNTAIGRRIELINYCKKENCLILEDDYNGELRYNTRPVPCIQSYDNENTVYIGSFSKLLLPAVRMSYMVLPPALGAKYKERSVNYNQTASKTEQLALAEYILQGKLEKHLRKLRRMYADKSRVTLQSITNIFGKTTKTLFNETALYVSVATGHIKNKEHFLCLCGENGIRIMKSENPEYEFTLSFSGISADKIEEGIQKISTLL